MVEYPVSKDHRYTVALEYCGHEKPRYVARFCGDWIGCAIGRGGAWMLAHGHNSVRLGADIIIAAKGE